MCRRVYSLDPFSTSENTTLHPGIDTTHPETYGNSVVSVHTYMPPSVTAEGAQIHMYDMTGCGMQFEMVYSLNCSLLVSFAHLHDLAIQNTNPKLG
jgi:hypothetical protein